MQQLWAGCSYVKQYILLAAKGDVALQKSAARKIATKSSSIW